ncbi:hypothetical protein CAL29_28055 [Bordetella genomosp. 10]|uniref:Chitin-binding type-3 domain-containing protein n=1 Tax=Bordetella genomosp. 10 TaxID=1416804 RepID=A0A261S4M2_9BORD|nr:hypothetical protein [Bordetella genomosp. 10]OZI31730.1 hypothetical protein CAL29_28055 [Bordetella genomosp. 10]
MKVIKPVTIGQAQLLSSNVPENDAPAYDPNVNYALGSVVLYQGNVYQSVQAPNMGNPPNTSPLYWSLTGPSNRWAMFDDQVSTRTVVDSPLTVIVKPGLVNSLALLELDARRLEVTGRDGAGGPVIYEFERSLEGSLVTNWYEYFFEPFSQVSEVVLTDLPAYGSLVLQVSIIAAGASVACGSMILGSAYFLGEAEYGGSAGIQDFSRKDTSETGVTTFRERRYSRRSSQRLWVETGRFTAVYRLLSSLRATPCVYIGAESDDYGPLTIFGFYRDFSIDIAYPLMNFCNLEIEGLT